MQIADVALSPAHPERRTRVVFGQPNAADLAVFAEAGARAVLDLRQAAEDRGFDEAATCTALGLRHLALPIAGAAGFTPGNVAAFARLVDDPTHHPLVVHCATANRVGALAALKAVWHDGRPRDEALALGREAGMRAIEPAVVALLDATPGAGR